MFKLFFSIAFCITVCSNVNPYVAAAYAAPNESEIDALINDALTTFNVPGAAIGIILDGKVAFTKGYGLRNIAQQLPVTETTLFNIASCTKAFSAFVLGQLVDEGLIDWDEPVKTYIPEFRLYTDQLTDETNIRDILSHRTGIARHDAVWFLNNLHKSDVMNILAHLEPACGLREAYIYNNFMYYIAGLVIERVTGRAWEEEVAARIFKPLNMNGSTTYLEEMTGSSNFSLPYARFGEQVKEIDFCNVLPVKPGAGINSNITDLMRWVQIFLSDDAGLISHATMKELLTAQISIPPAEDKTNQDINYGLGWHLGTYRGYFNAKHIGCCDGFTAEIKFFPEQNFGIVILSNSSTDGRYLITAISNILTDKILNLEPIDWKGGCQLNQNTSKILLAEIEALHAQTSLTTPSIPLAAFQGSYYHPAYGTIEIHAEDTQMSAFYAQKTFSLRHKNENTFTAKFTQLLYFSINPYVEFSFVLNEQNEVIELIVPFESFRGANPIHFQKLL